jgi:outer membrane protein assembly factor BamB
MDGNIYALDAAQGTTRWIFPTRAGISVAVLVVQEMVCVGSRDGHFYAIDLDTGRLKWSYRTVADHADHPHSGAPIMQSAASDGERIFFGAENMFFYALEVRTGHERWRKKLGGQSFMYSWPVVSGDLVMTFTMVPDGLSEFKMEKELEALPERGREESRPDYAARVWPQERTAIRQWLAEHPHYRNFHVMETADGTSPYGEEVPMGRVGGIGYPGRAPVLDQAGRILLYWRTKSAVFLTGGTFGTKYTPDISALDPATGDRVWFEVSTPMGAELDNNFTLTVGGDWLYLNNHMRGAHCLNLKTGRSIRATSILAEWDGANFRNWGNRLIWISNDDDPERLPPPSRHRSPQGDCGVVLATIRGRPMMFIQESGHYQIDFGCLAAVGGQP